MWNSAGSRAVGDALAKSTGNNDVPILSDVLGPLFLEPNGDMADKLSAACPGRFNGVGLVGGLHIDHLQGGNPLIQNSQYLLAGYSARANGRRSHRDLRRLGQRSVRRHRDERFLRNTASEHPDRYQRGTATAIVLPLRRVQRSPRRELVDGFFTVIFDQAGRNAFVYEPLDGHAVALRRVSRPGAARSTSWLGPQQFAYIMWPGPPIPRSSVRGATMKAIQFDPLRRTRRTASRRDPGPRARSRADPSPGTRRRSERAGRGRSARRDDAASPPRCPATPGFEVAGVVDAIGDGVHDVALGDHVVGWSDTGG